MKLNFGQFEGPSSIFKPKVWPIFSFCGQKLSFTKMLISAWNSRMAYVSLTQDRPLLGLWTVHFHPVGPSTFPQDRPLSPRPKFSSEVSRKSIDFFSRLQLGPNHHVVSYRSYGSQTAGSIKDATIILKKKRRFFE